MKIPLSTVRFLGLQVLSSWPSSLIPILQVLFGFHTCHKKIRRMVGLFEQGALALVCPPCLSSLRVCEDRLAPVLARRPRPPVRLVRGLWSFLCPAGRPVCATPDRKGPTKHHMHISLYIIYSDIVWTPFWKHISREVENIEIHEWVENWINYLWIAMLTHMKRYYNRMVGASPQVRPSTWRGVD